MKFFFWKDPYEVNYGQSYAYAIAENEDDARAAILARNDYVYAYGEYIHKRPNFTDLEGPPDRIVEIEPGASYAEILEWSE